MPTFSTTYALFGLVLLAAGAGPIAPSAAAEKVPFVGCPGDGQQGPVAGKKGPPKSVEVDAAAARELAWYQGLDSLGVLAPRGWKCFYVYGSSGASLLAAPSGNLKLPMDARWSGPAVTVTLDLGGTSGRFEVAKYAARLFAKEAQAFIDGVIAEGIEPKENFPFGPYPADKLVYKAPRVVEFETPAGQDGLGTSDRLQKSSLAVVGVAKLVDSGEPNAPDLSLVAVRLPPALAKLAPAIVGQSE